MKILETILVFVSFGFITIWVDQFIYKGASLGNSYFFLMFALASFMGYLYLRGKRVMKNQPKKEETKKKK
jgi:Na+-driven multidrug efflux pump